MVYDQIAPWNYNVETFQTLHPSLTQLMLDNLLWKLEAISCVGLWGDAARSALYSKNCNGQGLNAPCRAAKRP